MRTSKPFSTITYNTNDFLITKLDALLEKGIIDFYVFINHLPEEDETKEHTHLYIVPSILFDTRTLIDYLKQLDPNNEKPLTCINPTSSKFGDWFLYGLHDKKYLASKGQSRKYHYGIDEMIFSDATYFNELRHTIDYSKINKLDLVLEAVKSGQTLGELAVQGLIPVQQFFATKQVVDDVIKNNTNRGGRNGHEEQ